MELIGYVLLALVLGVGMGAAAVGLRRSAGSSIGTDAPGQIEARIEARLEVQAAEMRRLADAANARDLSGEQIRSGVEGARQVLQELAIRDQERRTVDAEHRDVIRRLATVLAGGSAKGRAGENVLREHLAELPPGMLVTDFRVGGKVVEFGLLLPDGRRLPIDSKWSAVAELEALEAATDTVERDACARAVEKEVVSRVREAAQYLDPALTAPVAVAAVPDAAYAVLRRAHADAYAKGVIVVPYSTALPVVLFLHSLVACFGDAAGVQTSLAAVAGLLDQMELVIENKMVRAATMINNGADELRSHLGKARGSVARATATVDVLPDGPDDQQDDSDSVGLSVVG